MTKLVALAAIASLGLSGAAIAAPEAPARLLTPADAVYAFPQIQAQRFDAAETRLTAQRAAEPREPSVLLNLAYVYARTNRQGLASGLYEDVLALPNVQMELASGKPAWSHDLAKRALSGNAAMASR